MFKRITILLFFLLFFSSNLTATDPDIYIVNFGPGDGIPFSWGHFAVLVDYPANEDKLDLIYDYGNFSPYQENFYTDFIQGVMNYAKIKKNAENELMQYIYTDRDITLYRLVLNQEQKSEYLIKLENDIKKENYIYQYDQFKNNCVSEVIKDLNNLTQGNLLKNTDIILDKSYRDLVREYITTNLPYYYLLNFIMGSKVDSNITVKESLFLPDYASNHIGKIMSDIEIPLHKSTSRNSIVRDAKPKNIISLIIGISLALVLLLITRFRKLDITFEIITGLIFFIFGSVLFFMSFFTGHYYIHQNFNLIFINPLSLTYLISGIVKAVKGNSNISLYFTLITVFMIFILLILKFTGVVIQDNLDMILLFTPPYLIKLFREYKGSRG